LYFDGNDYVATPAFALSGTVLTVSGWVKSDTSIRQVILSDNYSATLGFIMLWREVNTDWLTWQYANGSATVGPRMLTFFTGYNNTWVHFTVVADYSGDTIKYYRNGMWVQTDVMITPLFPSQNVVKYLGKNMANSNLDDIRIYNRELSASEIKAIYEGTK
jgi:hypothetical protein